ncbi:MAG: hypothetical protein K5989_01610 [Lachnospiraceae bacterium]|nr:hypothetical protein [Lachnospiraceae bacterium]
MENKKIIIKRILKILLLAAAVLLSVYGLQEYVVKPWDSSDQRITGFYMEPENSLDVVLMGASDVHYDFSSCRAYGEFGYTSYPFSCHQSTIGVWQTQVDEIMRTQSPAVIVIEINGALYMDEPVHSDENLRFFTNNMPNGASKDSLIEAYSDIYEPGERMSYYIPFLKYHGNLRDLGEAYSRAMERISLRLRGRTRLKGETTILGTARPGHVLDMTYEYGPLPLDPSHEEVLVSFLDHCRERDIPLLFIRSPHIIEEGDKKNIGRFHMTDRVAEIVAKYGYELIHFDRLHGEIGLDETRDFLDSDHLNLYGKEKFTDALSAYLLDRFPIEGRTHSQDVTAAWDESLAYYRQYREDMESDYANGREENFGLYTSESRALIDKLSAELEKKPAP